MKVILVIFLFFSIFFKSFILSEDYGAYKEHPIKHYAQVIII